MVFIGKKHNLRTIIIVILLSISISLGSYVLVKSVEKHFGIEANIGFFGGLAGSAEAGVLPSYDPTDSTVNGCSTSAGTNKTTTNDGEAIPKCVDTVDEFINFLNNRNDNGWSWNKTGSAFIANTIYCPVNNHNCLTKTVSDTGWWTAVKGKLTTTNIYIDWHVVLNAISVDTINTAYTGEGNNRDDALDDVAWYMDSSIKASEAIVVYYDYNGTRVPIYNIRRACGNLYGIVDFNRYWQATATSISQINNTGDNNGSLKTAYPGDFIKWTNTVYNTGGQTTRPVYSHLNIITYPQINMGGTPISAYKNNDGTGDTAFSVPVGLPEGVIRRDSDINTAQPGFNHNGNRTDYTVRLTDVGKTLCRQVALDRWNSNDIAGGPTSTPPSTYSAGNSACVNINTRDDYNLSPEVNLDTDGVVEVGSSIEVTPSVANSGSTSTPIDGGWYLRKFIFNPGVAISYMNGIDGPAGSTANSTCAFNYWGYNSCADPVSGGEGYGRGSFNTSGVFTLRSGTNQGYAPRVFNDTILVDYTAGTKICYVLTVFPPEPTKLTVLRHSPLSCVTVGKKPKVQIWGGDLMSGGKIQTSTSIKNMLTYGSWIEYGAFAFGNIEGFASGAAYRSPGIYATNGNNFCTASRLSFANVDCGSKIAGGYLSDGYSPQNIEASFPGGQTYNGTDFQPWGIGSGVWNIPNNVVLRYSSAPSLGHYVVLKSQGTVTIAEDLVDDANFSFSKSSEIPQLIIIANKIIIKNEVTRISAWLIARSSTGDGIIQTCETKAKDTNTCKNKLVVNGLVIADKLLLYRTAGSGPSDDSGTPAEIFNLRADAYLWAAGQAARNNSVKTVYTTELPPRF